MKNDPRQSEQKDSTSKAIYEVWSENRMNKDSWILDQYNNVGKRRWEFEPEIPWAGVLLLWKRRNTEEKTIKRTYTKTSDSMNWLKNYTIAFWFCSIYIYPHLPKLKSIFMIIIKYDIILFVETFLIGVGMSLMQGHVTHS